MGEPRKMPGGDLIRRATRVTTGTAVAATEVLSMSLSMTGRLVRKVVPRRDDSGAPGGSGGPAGPGDAPSR
ncbi:hypothetical protein GCM10009547_06020 [Sporichthya brevicatena]|uniref:Uncharacterized protein n=1 Tax=Sporichthya brevicatena TaxID=171442 RepID=A0ABN1G9I2_9ACTN